jgi:peroxiredoxin
MMIRVGDQLPNAVFTVMGPQGPETKSTADIFHGRAVALFGVAGAYTPTCHRQHLPGIIQMSSELKRHGIDTIACAAVNDIFVLDHWTEEHGGKGKVLMLADGNAEFALKTGLALDLTRFGLGIRSMRYVLLAKGGTVTLLNVEEIVTNHDRSSAATLCSYVANASA